MSDILRFKFYVIFHQKVFLDNCERELKRIPRNTLFMSSPEMYENVNSELRMTVQLTEVRFLRNPSKCSIRK